MDEDIRSKLAIKYPLDQMDDDFEITILVEPNESLMKVPYKFFRHSPTIMDLINSNLNDDEIIIPLTMGIDKVHRDHITVFMQYYAEVDEHIKDYLSEKNPDFKYKKATFMNFKPQEWELKYFMMDQVKKEIEETPFQYSFLRKIMYLINAAHYMQLHLFIVGFSKSIADVQKEYDVDSNRLIAVGLGILEPLEKPQVEHKQVIKDLINNFYMEPKKRLSCLSQITTEEELDHYITTVFTNN